MKNLLLICALASVVLTGQAVAASPSKAAVTPANSSGAEDWKGPTDGSEVHLGGILGLGILDTTAGFTLLGTASKKIIHHGFVPDITNSVSLETELGPIFTQGLVIFSYSLHLRWDFEMNEKWTFFALGGVGGYIAGSGFVNSFSLYPRFGVGGFYRVNDIVMIRAEISHELIAAGVTIPFYL